MKQFLFDTHVHTSQASSCAHFTAQQVVNEYFNRGYDGIIVTDHFNADSFKQMCGTRPWRETVDLFYSGYSEALEAAKQYGDFTVLLGMEIRFVNESNNDYLVYGIDKDFLYEHSDLTELDIESFRRIADENNLLIFQAHPFRVHMHITAPSLLDGIEIYNGNGNHNSSNDIAAAWAKRFSLRPLSGTDFHGEWKARSGGIIFNSEIKNNLQLVQALRSRQYSIY